MSQINPSVDAPFGNPIRPANEGHPPGLFLLFFVEMWERFSFYGMKALLLYYLIKGFMKADDGQAYAIMGAYGALVYATPYIGGMLADRFLGARVAVIWGGVLMAAGHLLMTIEERWALFGALGLLIVGNGFFKPNISTMVGSLYPRGSSRRDAGFTIFYMGINLGAALAPLVCGYIGETYGWHYGFGLATIGMLLGIVTFVVPSKAASALILLASLLSVGAMIWSTMSDTQQLLLNLPVAIALLAAGAISFMKLQNGELPADLGRPRDARGEVTAPRLVLPILIGSALLAIPFAFLVDKNASPILIEHSIGGEPSVYEFRPGTWLLNILGVVAFSGLLWSAISARGLERSRMIVVLVLCFFSMLFWAFFEQGGTSISNFTDRNIDRVNGGTEVVAGQTYSDVSVTQEFLGVEVAGRTWTLTDIDVAQKAEKATDEFAGYVVIDFKASEKDVKSGVTVDGAAVVADQPYAYIMTWREFLASPTAPLARTSPPEEPAKPAALPEAEAKSAGRVTFVADEGDAKQGLAVGGGEIKASVFQAANPTFILLFGPVFSWLWGALGRRDPSPGVKFALGLAQCAAGFACLWWGAKACDSNGMVAISWLLLGLLLHTTGELCLSPVGLSLVTKLAPARIVSTVMGAWFLATSFSHLLASGIATMTGLKEDESGAIPPPLETVGTYGEVFGMIGIAALASALLVLMLSPWMTRMMDLNADETPSGGAH
ncbi:MAG: peptide MFS transporter [Planctomycetaceae bacterium]|nr:peptide MFS transporter [Planctomycetaceae bacterium]